MSDNDSDSGRKLSLPSADVAPLYKDYSVYKVPPRGYDEAQDDMPVKFRKLPAKLNAMLSQPSYEHIISWMPHGRSWKIHDNDAFLKQVAPLFFDYQNFNSFIRLVNAWGFRRKMKGPDKNSYYHELFLRGRPHLHETMHRLGAKEKKVLCEEPDLDAYPAMPDLPRGVAPSTLKQAGPEQRSSMTYSQNRNVANTSAHQNDNTLQLARNGILQQQQQQQIQTVQKQIQELTQQEQLCSQQLTQLPARLGPIDQSELSQNDILIFQQAQLEAKILENSNLQAKQTISAQLQSLPSFQQQNQQLSSSNCSGNEDQGLSLMHELQNRQQNGQFQQESVQQQIHQEIQRRMEQQLRDLQQQLQQQQNRQHSAIFQPFSPAAPNQQHQIDANFSLQASLTAPISETLLQSLQQQQQQLTQQIPPAAVSSPSSSTSGQWAAMVSGSANISSINGNQNSNVINNSNAGTNGNGTTDNLDILACTLARNIQTTSNDGSVNFIQNVGFPPQR